MTENYLQFQLKLEIQFYCQIMVAPKLN